MKTFNILIHNSETETKIFFLLKKDSQKKTCHETKLQVLNE